jgi:hypothetical protein
MPNCWLFDGLCWASFDFHSHNHHSRAVVRYQVCFVLKQAVKIQKRCRDHGRRMDLFDVYGCNAAFWHQQLLVHKVRIHDLFVAIRYRRMPQEIRASSMP